MSSVASHAEVLRLWPSRTDVAKVCEVPYGVVKQWERRDSIPASYWPRLTQDAALRGFTDVTADRLADLAKPRQKSHPIEPERKSA